MAQSRQPGLARPRLFRDPPRRLFHREFFSPLAARHRRTDHLHARQTRAAVLIANRQHARRNRRGKRTAFPEHASRAVAADGDPGP